MDTVDRQRIGQVIIAACAFHLFGDEPLARDDIKNIIDQMAQVIANMLSNAGHDYDMTPNPNATVDFEWTVDGRQFTLEVGKTLISGYVKDAEALEACAPSPELIKLMKSTPPWE